VKPDPRSNRRSEAAPLRLGWWTAILLVSIPSLARAQDGDVDAIPDPEILREGPHDPLGLGLRKLSYAFGLEGAAAFDDNVFLTAHDRTSDTISILQLTAKARHDYGAGTASLTYRGKDRTFASHSEFNGLEHFFDASATLDSTPVRFETGLEWKALKDPFDVLQSSERVDSRFDREFLKATGDFGRLDAEVTVAAARFTVDDQVLDRGDYRRWEFSATSLFEAWPQVSILAGVGLRETRYDEDTFSDFTVLSLTAGARGSLTPKTRSEARVGFARAEPHGDSQNPAEDFSGFVAEITTTWEAGEKHEIRIDLSREPTESLLTGLAVSDSVRIGYKYAPAERWTTQGELSWEQRRESDGSGNRRGLQARAGVQWSLPGSLHADVGILFRMRESGEPDSDYENFRVSLGMGVQW
jgi:hypothetical protein